MRYLILALSLLLAACQKPAQPAAPETRAAAPATAPAVADTWPGKYEGDLMVTVTGKPGAHKVMLVTASQAGCTGDLGMAESGLTVSDVSPLELSLTAHPDPQTTCKVDLKKDGARVTVSEDNCGNYHGATCSFSGTATRVNN